MSEVTQKATDLAEAIKQSEELKALREAEQKLSADEEAMKLLNEVQTLQQGMQKAQTPEAMKQLEVTFNKFAANEIAKEFLEANQNFSKMIEDINKLLQSAISAQNQ